MENGELKFPKLNIEPFIFTHDFQTRLFLQYANILEKTEIGRTFAKTISNDPRVKVLEGQMISHGSGAQIFDSKTLTMWFLWCTNEYGAERANEYLNTFLDNSMVPVINALWVIGTEVTEPIYLEGEVEILPIDRLPDSRDKETFLQSRFGYLAQPITSPASAIICHCKIHKTQNNNDLVLSSDDHKFRQSSNRLHEIALLLNAVDGISCLPYYSTSYTYPTTPFGPFNSSGGGLSLYDVFGHNISTLSANDKPIIEKLIQNYDKLSNTEKKRFERILSRLSQAKRRAQIEDKILDLGITLEMLLLEDNGKNDQLSLLFSLRGSWLLGKTESERMLIYKQLRDIYSYRSQVAHSGVLCGGDSRKIANVKEAFSQYQSLAEQACRLILINGKPNWSEVILGIHNR